MEKRWVFILKAQDKPGALTAAAAVFSNRGISLETILGSGIALKTVDEGRIVLSFRATDSKKDMLLRVLQRSSSVLDVEALPYSASNLRAIAVVRISNNTEFNWDRDEVQMEVISQDSDSQVLLLTGTTLAVEAVIERLRDRQFLIDVTKSVMAV